MITEFAREQLAQRGVRILVPGERDRVVVRLSEEKNGTEDQEASEQPEKEQQYEEECGKKEYITASVGERCEVCVWANYQCFNHYLYSIIVLFKILN